MVIGAGQTDAQGLAPSGRVKLDRSIEALELKCLRLTVRHLRSGALIDRLCYENLVGFGDRLGPGGGVDDGADRCQVAVRPAELPKAEFTGMNANADAQFTGGQAERARKAIAPLAPALLNFPGSEQGIPAWSARCSGKLKTAMTASPIVLLRSPSCCQIAFALSS